MPYLLWFYGVRSYVNTSHSNWGLSPQFRAGTFSPPFLPACSRGSRIISSKLPHLPFLSRPWHLAGTRASSLDLLSSFDFPRVYRWCNIARRQPFLSHPPSHHLLHPPLDLRPPAPGRLPPVTGPPPTATNIIFVHHCGVSFSLSHNIVIIHASISTFVACNVAFRLLLTVKLAGLFADEAGEM